MRRGVGLQQNAKFIFCAVASVGILFGCGSASSPDATKVSDLKAAGGLKIYDQGNGSVKLVWTGTNPESDFSGYNIYGGKDTDGTLAALENKTIEMLNDSGSPTDEAKALLKKMSYNGTDWETAGAADAAAGDTGYYAYYKSKDTDGKTPLMPSCMPSTTYGSGVACTELTKTGATSTFSGTTSITLTGLKYDGKYCFAVFSTLKSGKKIAQSSSEVKCVVPRYKMDLAMTTAVSAGNYQTLTFSTMRTTCATAAGCGTLTLGSAAGSCTSTSVTAPICIETFGGTSVYFTSGAGSSSVVQDLGYYASGFNDENLQRAPIISAAIGSLKNDYGYSIPGQSVILANDHIYAVAENKSGTSFYYHLIYVKTVDSLKVTGEVRLAAKEDFAE